jgi:hypothetical protein
MADARISELTAIDAVAAADLLAIVDDPAGTPVTKKATASQIKDYIVALANTWTATQTVTPAANTSALASTGYSLTGSNAQSLIDLAGTWNTTGTPTALKLNVTDTASNASSLLMDLQVGGTSRAIIRKDGRIDASGINNLGQVYGGGSSWWNFGGSLNISSSGRFTINNDVVLGRRAAANFQLGAADAAAPVAQTLSVQSVVAGTSNTAGANLTITGSQGTGTGAGGSIIFQVAPAGSSGTAQNALAAAFQIDSTQTFSFGASAGTATTIRFGGPNYYVTATRGATSLNIGVGDNRVEIGTFPNITMAGRGWYGWSNGTTTNTATVDLYLYRDAAGVLALLNGTNAQTFRWYRTFTDASNYERGALQTASGQVILAAETAGTGGDDIDVTLTPAGAGNVRYGTHSALGAETVTGFITIKDAGGTTRKLAVVS